MLALKSATGFSLQSKMPNTRVTQLNGFGVKRIPLQYAQRTRGLGSLGATTTDPLIPALLLGGAALGLYLLMRKGAF